MCMREICCGVFLLSFSSSFFLLQFLLFVSSVLRQGPEISACFIAASFEYGWLCFAYVNIY